MLEYPFTLYQTFSLFLNGITSLLLIYFGLHQYAVTLRETKDGRLAVEKINFSNPSSEFIKSVPFIRFLNLGPGNIEEAELHRLQLMTSEGDIILNSERWPQLPDDKTEWRAGEKRGFTSRKEMSEEKYVLAQEAEKPLVLETTFRTETGKRSPMMKMEKNERDNHIELYPKNQQTYLKYTNRFNSWLSRNI